MIINKISVVHPITSGKNPYAIPGILADLETIIVAHNKEGFEVQSITPYNEALLVVFRKEVPAAREIPDDMGGWGKDV